MTDKAIIDAMRSEMTDDADLKESLQAHGWVKHFPALKDEHGVVLVGNRRLRIAKELGIEPVIKILALGEGANADAERFRVAIVSNLGGKPMSKDERQKLAVYLFKARNWTQQRISEGLGVHQSTVAHYLDDIYADRINVEDRGTDSLGRKKSTGRPKGKAPKPHKYPPATEQKAAELHLDNGKSVFHTAKELGVSEQVVIRSVERERGRREATQAEVIKLDPSQLSKTSLEKLDAFKRRIQKELDAAFEERIEAEVIKRHEYMTKADLEALVAADKIRNSMHGIMSQAQHRDLLRCLHPDSRRNVSDDVCNRSFQMIAELKAVLVKEDKVPDHVKIPRSAVEMLKRRDDLRRQKRDAMLKRKAGGNAVKAK